MSGVLYRWTGSAWAEVGTGASISASGVTNTPAGNIAATDVQAALNELDTEKSGTAHTHSGTSVWIKRTTRDGLGDITTSSATRTPVDATNLAYVTRTLAVGDLVKLTFACSASAANASYVIAFDFEVDQPTSANVYVANGNDFGVTANNQEVNGRHQAITAVATFVATEAGAHGFRPVWFIESGTSGTIPNASSGANDRLLTFLVEHYPAALVG